MLEFIFEMEYSMAVAEGYCLILYFLLPLMFFIIFVLAGAEWFRYIHLPWVIGFDF